MLACNESGRRFYRILSRSMGVKPVASLASSSGQRLRLMDAALGRGCSAREADFCQLTSESPHDTGCAIAAQATGHYCSHIARSLNNKQNQIGLVCNGRMGSMIKIAIICTIWYTPLVRLIAKPTFNIMADNREEDCRRFEN